MDDFGQYHVFTDVWCDGEGEVWAVADYTTRIVRFSSGSWSFIDTGLSLSNYGFHAIYGFSPTDIYAVGGCGQIIHYDGTWTTERKEGECLYNSFDLLYDVWGPDASNVFVTGNNSQALKRNSDGTWALLHSGNMFEDASKNSICGSGADDIYFVGAGGETDHWNGSTYTRVLLSNSDNGQNVIVRNASGSYYIGQDYGKISAFASSTRTALTTPPVSTGTWKFAQRADRIWLCKERMDPGDTIYAWDGSTWTALNPGLTESYGISTFRVLSENDIFLSGYQLGGGVSFAKRYNGSTWSSVNYGSGQLVDVAFSGADVFTIASGIWDNDMEGYLGAPCSNNEACYSTNTFKALALGDDGKMYAVGKSGAIVSYCDGAWAVEDSGTTKDLTSVAAGGGWVCAAGRDRTVVCKQGTGDWNAVTGLTTKAENKFLGVAYSGANTFVAILNTGNDGSSTYIGGDKGTLYKIDAGAATLLRTGMSSSLYGIGSNAEGEVAISGTGGIIYGNLLTPQPEPTTKFDPGIYLLLLLD